VTDVLARLTASLAGRYVIERELGAGGMATVYLAHDVRHDRKVALKVLRPELSAILGGERFLKEIRTTANLQHPHILPLHDSGEADGTVFYVMPYVDGESLRDRLSREKQLPVDDAVRIAREVADALAYAHQHGIIHRDIKPENILLHGGHAMVADFGIALAASRSDASTRMTETGMSLGTPHYMAPEQAMGEREITSRADIYALGCVLYEMLTGEPPFTGPTAQAIIARVMTEQPRSLTLQRHTVPPHVETVVGRALEKLPADRFATAAQFAEALASPGTTAAVSAAPLAAPARRADPWRSRFVAAAAVAMAALVLASWPALRGRSADGQIAWHFVSLGDSVLPNENFPALALAPDGSALVVRDNVQNGRLWLKRRGELRAAPIPGTERATNPAFSPDGQWVAFVADGRLKKIRVVGGAAITLSDSAAGGYGGVTWIDDASLVYVAPSINELRRIPAAGGAWTSVLRDTAGGGLGYPVALPGGRGVLFQNCSSGCVTMGVHVLDLASGAQHPLMADAAQAWYLPNGLLFFVRRDGVGLVAPFDLDRLELAGPASPVLEGVRTGGGFAQLAWARDGTLLYQFGAGAIAEVELVRVSRGGRAQPVDTAWQGSFNSAVVSPDGRRLAVGAGSTSGGLNIWIKQLDRGPFTRLTFSGGDRRPAWSPDGRMLAFIRDSAGSGTVMVKAADGSGPERRVARLDRQIQEVQWARDGRWLVVRTDNGTTGAGDILRLPVSGDSAPVPLAASPFTELMPALSPDGRWLAYSSNESETAEVYVRPYPDASAARWQVSNGGGMEPVWSPDSRELFFLDGSGWLVAASVRAAQSFAVVATQRLFDATAFQRPGFHQSFDVSPDGRTFLFARRPRAAHTADSPLVQVTAWFADIRARLQ
jgi:eukaryotic-like serine/threonine-protein kinase